MQVTDRYAAKIWLPGLLGSATLITEYFAPHATLLSVAIGMLALVWSAIEAWKRYRGKAA
jgi:hypothetical protein